MALKQRRMMIEDVTGTRYKLFSFTQSKDGSIYSSWSDIAETRWIFLSPEHKTVQLTDPFASALKLSSHGSGVQHLGLVNGANEMRQTGNHLLRMDQSLIGLRHILTAFISKPPVIETGSGPGRISDIVVKSAKELFPIIVVLFAVPATKPLKVSIISAFHVDDMSTPPEISFGAFLLLHHNIAWLIYATKHMDKWPAQSHACYFDGYHVPIFLPKESSDPSSKERPFVCEVRTPNYSLEGDALSIAF